MRHSKNFNTEELIFLISEKNKVRLLEFVKERIFERYIFPVENVPLKYKNGFNMMANACLSIEAFMKILNIYHKNDITSKPVADKWLFKYFFSFNILFEPFVRYSEEFYGDVRCGILHNGETNGLWKINREAGTELLADYNINANKFIIALKETINTKLNSYLDLNFDSKEWKNLIISIERIINNHNRFYFAYGSNMDEDRFRGRIGNNYIKIGRGILEGYEIVFNKKPKNNNGHGFANIKKNRIRIVEGILYQLTGDEFDVINSLKILDKEEGVSDSHYNRKSYKIKIDLNDENGKFASLDRDEVYAYIYVCENPGKIDNSLIPSSEYLDHLLAGKNHLTLSYYQYLKEFQH